MAPLTPTPLPAGDHAGLTVADLSAGYGGPPAVRGVSFAVPGGAFLTLLGPSGCGKSTLLKVIGGYLTPSAGTVTLAGRELTRLPPERRNVGMVFQNYALFPHLSARQNVAFGLEVRGLPRAERAERVDAVLDRVGLGPGERDRRPGELSGGQQQRVAVARALAIEPDVLLLDEPLANLDRRLREQLRDELRSLQRRTGVTTVMVTHDPGEAVAVSDLVGVMAGGRLLQVGPPADVYDRPRTPFVAHALGDANLLDGAAFGSPGRLVLVRPEAVRVGDAAAGGRWRWAAAVADVAFAGADVAVTLESSDGRTLRARAGRGAGLAVGAAVMVGVPDGAAWVIPEADA